MRSIGHMGVQRFRMNVIRKYSEGQKAEAQSLPFLFPRLENTDCNLLFGFNIHFTEYRKEDAAWS